MILSVVIIITWQIEVWLISWWIFQRIHNNMMKRHASYQRYDSIHDNFINEFTMTRWLEVWLIPLWIRRACWHPWAWCNSSGGVWCVPPSPAVVCGGPAGTWSDCGFSGHLETTHWYICDEFKYLSITKKLTQRFVQSCTIMRCRNSYWNYCLKTGKMQQYNLLLLNPNF